MAERKVWRRTRMEIICDELVKVDRNRLREVLLAELLVERHGWPVDETYAAIQRGVDDPEVQMFRTRDNGWTIVFSGTERVAGGVGVGLYDDVATVLVERWARAEAVARELGVGLVTYGKPWLWSTWTTVYRARSRDPRPGERARFKSVALQGEARSHG